MKVILIVILVVIALYLYRRTQAVAKQERDKTDRNAAANASSSEAAQPSTVAEPEQAVIDKPIDDTVLADSPVDAPEITSFGSVDEPIDISKTAAADSLPDSQHDINAKPDAVPHDTDATIAVSSAEVGAKAPDTPAVDVSISSQQGQSLNLKGVAGDWASESFQQQLDVANKAIDLQSQHDGLVSVINHCYKMRKQADYCHYGAALQLTYMGLYRVLHQQHMTQKSTAEIKSPAFMPLSTLLNDVGQFDEAITVCEQALEYQLTDGTVTGFEGRIKRIQKAKAKAS